MGSLLSTFENRVQCSTTWTVTNVRFIIVLRHQLMLHHFKNPVSNFFWQTEKRSTRTKTFFAAGGCPQNSCPQIFWCNALRDFSSNDYRSNDVWPNDKLLWWTASRHLAAGSWPLKQTWLRQICVHACAVIFYCCGQAAQIKNALAHSPGSAWLTTKALTRTQIVERRSLLLERTCVVSSKGVLPKGVLSRNKSKMKQDWMKREKRRKHNNNSKNNFLNKKKLEGR